MIPALEKSLDKKVDLCYLTPDKYDDFFNFELTVNEGKKNLNEIKDRFKSLILDNPLLGGKPNICILIASTSKSQIIGKLVCRPVEFYFHGIKQTGYYYCDFFVDKNYRKKGIGTSIVERALQEFNPAFINPASNNSLVIALSLKFELVGSLRKFVWLRNIWPFNLINDKEVPFPHSLTLEKSFFNLVRSQEKWNDYPFFPKSLEFVRTLDYLNWHMSIKPSYYNYYFNADGGHSVYFAVKKTLWRGLKMLEIVDYKVPASDVNAFRLIINATKKIAEMLNFNGVIVMSTHCSFDKILQKSFFIMIGRPMHFLTTFNTNFSKEDIKKRKVFFATVSDL